ncbi:MAG: hypothetical protein RI935_756 [Candidatus Parcubacteria bacterium]|jgi:hypothetical protein
MKKIITILLSFTALFFIVSPPLLAISICPGEPLAVAWTATNALSCSGSWSASKVSFPVTVTSGSKSYGDTSKWAPGNYSVSYVCSLNQTGRPASGDTATIKNDSSCACGNGSTASLCTCPSDKVKASYTDTTYFCPVGYTMNGSQCVRTVWECDSGGFNPNQISKESETKFASVFKGLLSYFRLEVGEKAYAAKNCEATTEYEEPIAENIAMYRCDNQPTPPVININIQ